jgi:hypothetical protein
LPVPSDAETNRTNDNDNQQYDDCIMIPNTLLSLSTNKVMMMMMMTIMRRSNCVTMSNIRKSIQRQHRTYIQFDDPNQNFIDASTSPSYPKQPQQHPNQQQQQHGQYVWQEPPGRMKKIMEIIRISDKRYQYMHNRSLMKIKEVSRRIRLSNSAMVTRIALIKELYEDCSAGLQQIKQKLQVLCEQHNLTEQVQQIQPRRKYHFKENNDHFDIINDDDEEEVRNYDSIHPVDKEDAHQNDNDKINQDQQPS